MIETKLKGGEMSRLMMVMMTLTAVAMIACSGSKGKGQVKSAGSVRYAGQAEGSTAEAAWPMGQPTPDSTNTTSPPSAKASGPALPPECNGRVPAGHKVGSNITSCVCESGGWRSTWGTYRWDNSFPACKTPYPDQVVRGAVGDPNEANPYDERGEATDGRVRVTGGTGGTQVRCATTVRGENSIAVCQVKRGDAEPESYSCVGPGVQALTLAEQAGYTGGPPCTCKEGSPRPVGDSVPNTWQCK